MFISAFFMHSATAYLSKLCLPAFEHIVFGKVFECFRIDISTLQLCSSHSRACAHAYAHAHVYTRQHVHQKLSCEAKMITCTDKKKPDAQGSWTTAK